MAYPIVQYRNSSGKVATVEFWRNPVNGACEAVLFFPGKAYFGAGMDAGEAWVALRRTIRQHEESGDLVRVRGEE
jgi:hypothetical protein